VAGKLRVLGQKLASSTRAKLSLPTKQVEGFYSSPAWRLLCEEIKRERWPLLLQRQGHCCEDLDCKARHSPTTRIFFDHLKERRDHPDLALVKSNIMGRCGSSHSRKTAAERARRYQQRG
jgi:5-methylcytosine-specific restriction protein A